MIAVEVLVRWTELKMKKNEPDEDAYVKRLVHGEDDHQGMMMNQFQASYQYSPMTLNLEDVARFNRSNDANYTTLRMADGEGFVIKYPYTEFQALFADKMNSVITCLIPENYEAQGEVLKKPEFDEFDADMNGFRYNDDSTEEDI